MKTLRFIGMALFAIFMCANFVTCSNEEVEPNSSEKVTVNFDLTGHFLDIENTPLGRATGNNFYGIQVYTITNTGNKIPYAFGTLSSLEDVTIDLIKSQKYKFEVTVVIDGADSFTPAGDFTWSSVKDEYMGKFTYSTSLKIKPNETSSYAYLPFDRYYGVLEEYLPTENGTVTIDTKRVSYGIKFIAENLYNGCLTVKYSYYPYLEIPVDLTSDNPSHEQVLTFSGLLENVYNFYDSHTDEISFTLTWKLNADDPGTSLGTYNVTVKPNVKSTVKINVNSIGTSSNGITINTDETDMIEEEYTLENGELS